MRYKKILHSKIFLDTSTYTIVNIVEKMIPFLIIPILTRMISKEDMGYYTLYQVTFQLLLPILTLSMDNAIMINFYKLNKKIFARYFSTGIYLSIIIYFIGAIIAFIFSNTLSSLFGLPVKWLEITILIVFLRFLSQLRLNILRMEMLPIKYGLFSIPLTFLKNSLGLLFILHYDYGWEGIILGHLIGQALFSIIALVVFIKDSYLNLSFHKDDIVDLIKIGVPYSIHRISAWISTSLNRFIINLLLGAAATGSFGIGATFSTIIIVLEDAVNKAYAPYLFKKLANHTNKDLSKIVKLVYVYYFLFISLGAIIYLIGYFGVGIIFGDTYLDTRSFILPLILSAVINGLYKIHVNFILFTKKTYIVARNTIITAIINIGLAYFMILKCGLIGAAYSATIIQAILYILTVRESNKLYKLPWLKVIKHTNQ